MAKTLCPNCQRSGEVADFLAKLGVLCKSCGTRVAILAADGSLPAPQSPPATADLPPVPAPVRSSLASVVTELANAPPPKVETVPPARPERRLEFYNEIVLATLLQRWLAHVLSRIVLIAGAIVIVVLAFGMAAGLDVRSGQLLLVGWAMGVAVYSALFLYLRATRGQDIGKYFIGIKIVREDGSPAGLVHSFLKREFLFDCIVVGLATTGQFFMESDTCLGPIGYAIYFAALLAELLNTLAIFGENRQCLHDRLAGTIVVKEVVPRLMTLQERFPDFARDD
jgi:uncharacterized RDD family membrane protein YckC